MARRFSVVLIGLGNIGAGYDLELPLNSEKAFTHASAFFQHPGFELIAAIDPDEAKCRAFEAKYAITTCPAIEQADAFLQRADVIVVAVPTGAHEAVLKQIEDYSAKGIVCEKPLTNSLQAATKVVEHCSQREVTLLMNYPRSFSAGMVRLLNDFKQGKYGRLLSAQVIYCRGFLNNCSHFLDLVFAFAGDELAVEMAGIQQISSFGEQDFEANVLLMLNSSLPVYCQSNAAADYFSGRVTLYTHNGLLTIDEQGRVLFAEQENTPYGDQALALAKQVEQVDFATMQSDVVECLYRHLQGEQVFASASQLKRATAILSIYEKLKRSW